MKALLMGDIHLSDVPPRSRSDTYTEDILNKLRESARIAKEHNVDCVIWAGDVFHLKAPTRTSHALVRETATIGNSYHCPWLIVPGNHDMTHDRLDSIPRQPLGVLLKAGAYALVGQHPDLPVYGVPWLQDWSKLPVAFSKYTPFAFNLVVTHAPIMPPGQTAIFEYIDARDWAKIQREGSCFYGHIHDPHGAYTFEDVTFCNNGSIARGSLRELDLIRTPAVTLWSDEWPERFRKIELPCKPSSEVFRTAIDDKTEREAREDGIETFLASIRQTSVTRSPTEDLMEAVKASNASPAVKHLAHELLELASSKAKSG